ncbi:MAG: hypothetical protein A2504_01530 [Bdellovibrionales bacterium RIFOXYD12_FULL_39_22]|nr:MAG: hypothetical protein A2385_04055 [Bdellovibrionales bacterium RIFOXYB1_FULL_39_21]OFZ42413.1 MAG: hypothetical protein A2485_15440 [Bdellovibrionales bacterium RIFOXYC12_FULL_39_17]OFZ46286.1 MAG: hypothetical protein A2404_13575 [Bdellovibrionales bacterium RIFOXYC1_FULL_39_130]OFZ70400.1 MAG: hypothetical protein A2451_09590 [Bdellovibrionales bacterium RIFOXYC2_FULL_39_8]OFZ75179.1 MAG: hypothetical protein A2560_15630 [Bdellovibrionales bacterium RIFOXYD1_FULL_39_84]OFZ93173.1 MAG:
MAIKIGKIVISLLLLAFFASVKADDSVVTNDETSIFSEKSWANYRSHSPHEIMGLISRSKEERAAIEESLEIRELASITEEERILWEEVESIMALPPVIDLQ